MTQSPAHLAICLLALTVSSCATRGSGPNLFPGTILHDGIPEFVTPTVTEASAGVSSNTPSTIALTSVIPTALAQQGTPYRWGGSDPSGFDCSGLMQYAFAQHGIALPRQTADQYGIGHQVPAQDIQPGDLVFFQTVSPGPSHVGLMIGDDRFIHAPSSGGVVRIERLSVVYWSRRIIGARRVTIDATPKVLPLVPTETSERAAASSGAHRPQPFPSTSQ